MTRSFTPNDTAQGVFSSDHLLLQRAINEKRLIGKPAEYREIDPDDVVQGVVTLADFEDSVIIVCIEADGRTRKYSFPASDVFVQEDISGMSLRSRNFETFPGFIRIKFDN